jgi:hypothetical protein
VPTYKEELSDAEKISLTQLKAVLGQQYDIYFICPMSLNSEYLSVFKNERFEDKYFSSIEGYNRLMLSECFYSRFKMYEYMLIYQLDAFVFEDRLLEFCNYGYDYIGAPWITGLSLKMENGYKYVNVGNGGFSLRRIKACLSLVHIHKDELKTYEDNEDKFFAVHMGGDFNVAPIDIALQFSFEREVRECYKLNNYCLPFGCHAWEKYDWGFWQPILKELGYNFENIEDTGKLDIENAKLYKQQKKMEAFWGDRGSLCMHNPENREIIIWGTGKYGKRMLEIFERMDIHIAGLVDNSLEKQGTRLGGYVIFKPSVIEKMEKYMVIIAIQGEAGREVKSQLMEMGKVYYKDFVFYYDIVCL